MSLSLGMNHFTDSLWFSLVWKKNSQGAFSLFKTMKVSSALTFGPVSTPR